MKLPGSLNLKPFLFVTALLTLCQPALAEKRVALVIGNSAYQNAATLANPVNDAATIATTLRDAGFDVVDSRHDLSLAETRRVLRGFSDRAADADVAVVYYAGHGLELDGTNYLIPVDAKLERDSDVYDETFSLDRILVSIEPARQLRLVILDACRDNPFAKVMKRTLASRAVSRGLAKIEPSSPNTLIAYSAKAGSTALDGNSNNSPFTVALAKHLTTPGLDIRRAFGFVRDEVLKSTGNRQEPFVYGSLGGDDVPLVPAKATQSSPAAAPVANPRAEVRGDYELAQQIGNASAFNAFLAQHPDGFYADLARIQLDKIAAEDARLAATEKARLAEQERARLAAEGAQKSQQAKAEADAKATELARVAAEKAKLVVQEQVTEAERKRIASETPATDKVSEKPAASPSTTDKPQAAQGEKGPNLASLTAGPTPADITKALQTELRRVGCLTAAADGEWNAASQRSLTLFNRNAGTKLDVKTANLDALDAIKLKPGRVCPLICEHGFRANGERCTRIVCAEGSFLNDDNECEKQRARTPTAKRDRDRDERPAARRDRDDRPVVRLDRPERQIQERPRPEPGAGRSQPSGQIVCGQTGCRPVERGCHLEFRTTAQGGPVEGGGGNVQICN